MFPVDQPLSHVSLPLSYVGQSSFWFFLIYPKPLAFTAFIYLLSSIISKGEVKGGIVCLKWKVDKLSHFYWSTISSLAYHLWLPLVEAFPWACIEEKKPKPLLPSFLFAPSNSARVVSKQVAHT
ncbi:hypothetical protein GOP47_0026884 [Adiantum capillus-veneris]|nr:hypothetical protein GOP47_0026884 [Adiantum capillus-veneris]